MLTARVIPVVVLALLVAGSASVADSPSSGAVVEIGPNVPISVQFVTVLKDGRILVTASSPTPAGAVWSITDGWTSTPLARAYLTVALLHDGRVLLTGTNYADLYDPVQNTVTPTGSTKSPRGGPATVLASGRVLILNGSNSGTTPPAELYDSDLGTFSDVDGFYQSGIYQNDLGGYFLLPRSDGSALSLGKYGTWQYTPGTHAFSTASFPTWLQYPLNADRLSAAVRLADGRFLCTTYKDPLSSIADDIQGLYVIDAENFKAGSFQQLPYGSISKDWNWSGPVMDPTGNMAYLFGRYVEGTVILKLASVDVRFPTLVIPDGDLAGFGSPPQIPTHLVGLPDGRIAAFGPSNAFYLLTPERVPVTTAPTAPAAVVARPQSTSTDALVSWTDLSSGEDGFTVEARAADGTTRGTAAADATQAAVTLSQGWTGDVRVGAYNAAGTTWSEYVPLAVQSGSVQAAKKLNFGKTKLGTNKAKSVTVKNRHKTQPLFVLIEPLAAPFGVINAVPVLIPPKKFVKLMISFGPAGIGPNSGSLTLSTSDPAVPSLNVVVSGVGK